MKKTNINSDYYYSNCNYDIEMTQTTTNKMKTGIGFINFKLFNCRRNLIIDDKEKEEEKQEVIK